MSGNCKANRRQLLKIVLPAALLVLLAVVFWRACLAPTRILVVNATLAQQADMALNNDNRHIRLRFLDADQLDKVPSTDALMLFSRGLYLDEAQTAAVEKAGRRDVTVFTLVLSNQSVDINYGLTQSQTDTLLAYFRNPSRSNYRNGLRYLRRIATPLRLGDRSYEAPAALLKNMYYHREYGRYFPTHEAVTEYLKEKGLYHSGGASVLLMSGLNFPMEGNRAHVDTLLTRLTDAGCNVYPLTASGPEREKMIRALHPDAVVYLPMGRLGDDDFIGWLNDENIPVFNPYPIIQPHDEWIDPLKPISSGTLTARVVVPEIDGGIGSYCLATQNLNPDGFYLYTPETERINSFMEYFARYMSLRTEPNREKRVAIGYFQSPRGDGLIASGMEVIPSLYRFLQRLRREGYDVSGLPENEAAFARMIHQPTRVGLSREQYERWAGETLLPEKYVEVVERYGTAPGRIMARGDSLSVDCLQFGHILLFHQPKPAVGEDEFRLVHGAGVAPPHNYIAAYLYLKKGFGADALIHFGTHGNLEFTPGKNVGQSQADWSDVLVGNLPHFYFYTTGNVGEGIIAKRRTHAVLVTYLTPPYVESGMRQRYSALLDDIHKAIDADGGTQSLGLRIKQEAVRLGLHRDLGLDSTLTVPFTVEELKQLDAFAEEIADEKIIGAYYTLGTPYSERDLITTTLAVAADPLAYERARRDRDAGKITTEQLQNLGYLHHHYLPAARNDLTALLQRPPKDTAAVAAELRPALIYREGLLASSHNEVDAMLRALDGGTVAPAPGGDPVLNPNVLPTGRNMFSINAEATPNPQAWEDGKRLAEETLRMYYAQHGEYPRKVSYTFWAGEFIATEGATLAQAFWMLGVEPLRDKQGRVVDLRVVPGEELGRPRINVLVQVSGQLRDIAGSRLRLLTDAVKAASEAPAASGWPNYVAEGTEEQERTLLAQGLSPVRSRELATMRVFGPLNSGYSTGMMSYVEDAGQWGAERELAEGYLNNMGAAYGDEDNWADFEPGLFSAALARTDVIIQPRQSNTWGPLSLDHVYEFTGGLSLAVREVTGKEPDAMMADYRNSRSHRMQDARQALAVETRATILNPTFIRERMNGGEGTAQMFGELFRNVFGWSVTRSSMLDPQLYDDLYRLYFEDSEGLGIRDYLEETNPAAFTSMTQVLLDCASKGYWKPDIARLQQLKALRAQQLQVVEGPSDEVVLREERLTPQAPQPALQRYAGWVGAVLALVLFGLLILLLRHKRS
ncbi:MAG: cobaltochelatase subunit CobN [Bacteroidales bacterium]|nr:cobaltochelatase subunit CobN [Bacteroidales bacterium]